MVKAVVSNHKRVGKNKNIDDSLYYSLGKVLSYNAVYHFICGGRGIGKSFTSKVWAISDFIKNGKQFMYVRRYKTDLHARFTFFADVSWKFPGYGFRVEGMEAQICFNPDDKKPEWVTMGFFVQLSNAQNKKSVAYPNVNKIIFDEFIIEKGTQHYLPDEPRVFLELFSTVDRGRDETRALFLANAISMMNPYFIEYHIEPTEKEFVVKADGFIVCHFPNDADFSNAMKKTRFGKFIAGTEYEDYSIGNHFRDNTDLMLGKKTPEAKLFGIVETKLMTFSVWQDLSDAVGVLYVQEKVPPGDFVVHTLVAENMDNDKVLLHYSDRYAQLLRSSFKHGRVFFDSARTRNAFTEIFKR